MLSLREKQMNLAELEAMTNLGMSQFMYHPVACKETKFLGNTAFLMGIS